MRRWIAILLLCLAGAYLSAADVDECATSSDEACAPICHLLCSDGCATVPVPEPPVPPSPDQLPRTVFKVSPPSMPLLRAVEPEKTPPRG
ncbi:MAG: hypothetical protein HGB30_02025 [Holophagaceae bacterium]|nr:hypothetical protein [Holophagaceae bacterium]